MPNAGHVGNPIAHTHSMTGLIGGLIVGAIVGAALAVAVVATGGAALIAVAAVGAAVAAGGGIGQVLGSMSWAGVDITGAVLTGSPNVFVNGTAAAFAHIGTGGCTQHGPAPQLLAQGSDNVFVNGLPFGRVGDMHTCSGKINQGSNNVFVGGGTATTDEINPEIPAWVNWTLGAIGLASAVILAGPLVAVVGTLGGIGGGALGEWGGGKLFGEGSDGQKWTMLAGSFAGGFLGAKGGNYLGNRFIPRPVGTTQAFIRGGAPAAEKLTPTIIERNKISNLSEKGDIDGAREILKPYVDAKDVKGIIDRLDVESPKDGGYLWSGDKLGAKQLAAEGGGVTLEATRGGRVIDDWDYMDQKMPWDQGGEDIWGGVSTKYTGQLRGDVKAYQTPDKIGGGFIFKKYEYPVLKEGLKSGRITSFNAEIIGENP